MGTARYLSALEMIRWGYRANLFLCYIHGGCPYEELCAYPAPVRISQFGGRISFRQLRETRNVLVIGHTSPEGVRTIPSLSSELSAEQWNPNTQHDPTWNASWQVDAINRVDVLSPTSIEYVNSADAGLEWRDWTDAVNLEFNSEALTAVREIRPWEVAIVPSERVSGSVTVDDLDLAVVHWTWRDQSLYTITYPTIDWLWVGLNAQPADNPPAVISFGFKNFFIWKSSWEVSCQALRDALGDAYFAGPAYPPPACPCHGSNRHWRMFGYGDQTRLGKDVWVKGYMAIPFHYPPLSSVDDWIWTTYTIDASDVTPAIWHKWEERYHLAIALYSEQSMNSFDFEKVDTWNPDLEADPWVFYSRATREQVEGLTDYSSYNMAVNIANIDQLVADDSRRVWVVYYDSVGFDTHIFFRAIDADSMAEIITVDVSDEFSSYLGSEWFRAGMFCFYDGYIYGITGDSMVIGFDPDLLAAGDGAGAVKYVTDLYDGASVWGLDPYLAGAWAEGNNLSLLVWQGAPDPTWEVGDVENPWTLPNTWDGLMLIRCKAPLDLDRDSSGVYHYIEKAPFRKKIVTGFTEVSDYEPIVSLSFLFSVDYRLARSMGGNLEGVYYYSFGPWERNLNIASRDYKQNLAWAASY